MTKIFKNAAVFSPRVSSHGYEKLCLQGAREIKAKLHRAVEEIKAVTVTREVDRWFACFSVEPSLPEPRPQSAGRIAMDAGTDSFAAPSDGSEKMDSPQPLKAGLAKLLKAQGKVSRLKRASHRPGKAAILLAKAQRKIRSQRSHSHHELSHWMVLCFGFGVIEDLNIRGLSRGESSRAVHDAGRSFFAMVRVQGKMRRS